MNTVAKTVGLVVWISSSIAIQADFRNLDFEAGDLSKTVAVAPGLGTTRAGNMDFILPGWQIQYNNQEPTQNIPINVNVDYSELSTFGLYDRIYWRQLPLEGKAAFLATPSTIFDGRDRVSILQRGAVPIEAMSLRYECLNGAFEVWLDGTRLPLVDLERDAAGAERLREVSADVSAWAGKEVSLKFTQEAGLRWSAIDSIRFSPEPVIPEPSKRGVIVAGIVVLGCLGGGLRRIKDWFFDQSR
jgi:hypothetical protein